MSPSRSLQQPPHLGGSAHVCPSQSSSDPRTTVMAGGTKAFWHGPLLCAARHRRTIHVPTPPIQTGGREEGGWSFSLLYGCAFRPATWRCAAYTHHLEQIWIINQNGARLRLITSSQPLFSLFFSLLSCSIYREAAVNCLFCSAITRCALQRLITAAVSLTQQDAEKSIKSTK